MKKILFLGYSSKETKLIQTLKDLRKYQIFNSKKKIKLSDLNDIDLIITFGYRHLINQDILIKNKKIINLHISYLPYNRGAHPNFWSFAENTPSGVSIHKIDSGIDTGNIISQIRFKIPINATAYENYLKLMKYAVILLKKNIKKILNDNYSSKKQKLEKGSYYNRSSVDYSKLSIIKQINNDINIHNHIRSLIFPPLQLPKYKKKFIIKSFYKNKKIQLRYKK